MKRRVVLPACAESWLAHTAANQDYVASWNVLCTALRAEHARADRDGKII